MGGEFYARVEDFESSDLRPYGSRTLGLTVQGLKHAVPRVCSGKIRGNPYVFVVAEGEKHTATYSPAQKHCRTLSRTKTLPHTLPHKNIATNSPAQKLCHILTRKNIAAHSLGQKHCRKCQCLCVRWRGVRQHPGAHGEPWQLW